MTPMSVQSVMRRVRDDQRAGYVQTLVRMMVVEQAEQSSWRHSQAGKPTGPYIPALAGHINKLENEGIVKRTYDSGNQTYYQIDTTHREVIDVVNQYSYYLDKQHEELLENLDPSFGMIEDE